MEGTDRMAKRLSDIVREWLRDHGFDGLCNCAAECGCRLDDLMPCEEPGPDCEAGYDVDPPDDRADDVHFWIAPQKAPAQETDQNAA